MSEVYIRHNGIARMKVWQLISNNFAERALVKDFLREGGGGLDGKRGCQFLEVDFRGFKR